MKSTLNTCNAKVFHSRQNTENMIKINVGTKTSKTKLTSERNVKKLAHCVSHANATRCKEFFLRLAYLCVFAHHLQKFFFLNSFNSVMVH